MSGGFLEDSGGRLGAFWVDFRRRFKRLLIQFGMISGRFFENESGFVLGVFLLIHLFFHMILYVP